MVSYKFFRHGSLFFNFFSFFDSTISNDLFSSYLILSSTCWSLLLSLSGEFFNSVIVFFGFRISFWFHFIVSGFFSCTVFLILFRCLFMVSFGFLNIFKTFVLNFLCSMCTSCVYSGMVLPFNFIPSNEPCFPGFSPSSFIEI